MRMVVLPHARLQQAAAHLGADDLGQPSARPAARAVLDGHRKVFLWVVVVIPDSGVFAGFVILMAMRVFLQAGAHGRGASLWTSLFLHSGYAASSVLWLDWR